MARSMAAPVGTVGVSGVARASDAKASRAWATASRSARKGGGHRTIASHRISIAAPSATRAAKPSASDGARREPAKDDEHDQGLDPDGLTRRTQGDQQPTREAPQGQHGYVERGHAGGDRSRESGKTHGHGDDQEDDKGRADGLLARHEGDEMGPDGERHPEARAADGQPAPEDGGHRHRGDRPGGRRHRHPVEVAGLEQRGDDGGADGSGRRGSCDGSSSPGRPRRFGRSIGVVATVTGERRTAK